MGRAECSISNALDLNAHFYHRNTWRIFSRASSTVVFSTGSNSWKTTLKSLTHFLRFWVKGRETGICQGLFNESEKGKHSNLWFKCSTLYQILFFNLKKTHPSPIQYLAHLFSKSEIQTFQSPYIRNLVLFAQKINEWYKSFDLERSFICGEY